MTYMRKLRLTVDTLGKDAGIGNKAVVTQPSSIGVGHVFEAHMEAKTRVESCSMDAAFL
jgi:hypothetical protein